MFNWKMLLLMLIPMLETVGWAKVNEDENETGKDDIIGQSILFGVKLLRAIGNNDSEALKKMIPQDQLKAQVNKNTFPAPRV